METHGEKGLGGHVVPVFGGPLKAIKGFLKQPVFSVASIGVTDWRPYNSDLIIRQGGIAERVFIIRLFKFTSTLNRRGDHKA